MIGPIAMDEFQPTRTSTPIPGDNQSDNMSTSARDTAPSSANDALLTSVPSEVGAAEQTDSSVTMTTIQPPPQYGPVPPPPRPPAGLAPALLQPAPPPYMFSDTHCAVHGPPPVPHEQWLDAQVTYQLFHPLAMAPVSEQPMRSSILFRSPIDINLAQHSWLTIDLGVVLRVPHGYTGMLTGSPDMSKDQIVAAPEVHDGASPKEVRLRLFNNAPREQYLKRGVTMGTMTFWKQPHLGLREMSWNIGVQVQRPLQHVSAMGTFITDMNGTTTLTGQQGTTPVGSNTAPEPPNPFAEALYANMPPPVMPLTRNMLKPDSTWIPIRRTGVPLTNPTVTPLSRSGTTTSTFVATEPATTQPTPSTSTTTAASDLKVKMCIVMPETDGSGRLPLAVTEVIKIMHDLREETKTDLPPQACEITGETFGVVKYLPKRPINIAQLRALAGALRENPGGPWTYWYTPKGPAGWRLGGILSIPRKSGVAAPMTVTNV